MGDATQKNGVIGVAVIGIGRIGKVHSSNIIRLPRVQLLYIIDVCKDAAQQYIDEFSLTAKALHTDEIEVALNDERLEAVLVCCPTQMHEKHVKEALNRGKAVMCEKPLALSVEAVAGCYEAAEKVKKPLFCAFNRRFDPQTASIRHQIPEVVGNIKVIKTVSRDAELAPIEYLKISGGFVLDSCIHDMDMLIWMSGQVPETIYALGQAHFDKVREIGDVDQMFLTIKFPDGAFGNVDIGREAKYGHDQRLEIFGSKGMLTSENLRPHLYSAHTQSGSTVPPIYDTCMSRYNQSYMEELKHFMDVVRGTATPSVSGKETICTTLCCYAANESLATGNPVNVRDFVKKKYPRLFPVLETMSHSCASNKNEV